MVRKGIVLRRRKDLGVDQAIGCYCEILRRAYLMEGAVVGVETLAGSTLLWKYYIVNICLGEWSVMLFTESCHMYHVSNAKFQNNWIQSDAEQILICLWSYFVVDTKIWGSLPKYWFSLGRKTPGGGKGNCLLNHVTYFRICSVGQIRGSYVFLISFSFKVAMENNSSL